MQTRRLLLSVLSVAMFAAGRAFVTMPAAGLSRPSRVSAALSRRLCGDARLQVPCFVTEPGVKWERAGWDMYHSYVNVVGMCKRERVLVCG
jgi:hypothetical protein